MIYTQHILILLTLSLITSRELNIFMVKNDSGFCRFLLSNYVLFVLRMCCI